MEDLIVLLKVLDLLHDFLKTSGLYCVQLFIRTATQKERIVVASSAFVYTNAYFALQNAC